MDNLIQISAKNLGALALPNFCPRCFWIKLKLHNKLPWQIFPGIFSSIDSYSKKITWKYYDKYKSLPPWFTELGDFVEPVKVPHFNKFFIIDEESGVKLTGVPDEIVKTSDNKCFIVDYKTARFTEHQDSLMPLYKVQLNGYAMIGEKCGFSPMSAYNQYPNMAWVLKNHHNITNS